MDKMLVVRIVTRLTTQTLSCSSLEVISTNASSHMMATLVKTMILATVQPEVNFQKSARVKMIRLLRLRSSSPNS